MTAHGAGEDHRIRRGEAVLSQRLDDEAVLLDASSGRYYRLNEVGMRVWELAAGAPTLGDVHRSLLNEFEVDAELLWRDLARLVEELEAEGLTSVERRPEEEP